MELFKLAIIIPAYKDEFLTEALQSLVNQTNHDFSVYVGDDCSPYDIKSIVSRFESDLHIHYVRFSENLGGSSLIAHWNRCIKLLQGEEYFCFFSDDDVMEANCVEKFYETLNTCPKSDVYHFDINIIDEFGKQITTCPPYPEVISSSEFFMLLYSSRIDARMPEFIFNTQHFHRCGGFIEFDLAFRSDNATVMSCAQDKGVRTIPSARVLWRDSGKNISSVRNERLEIRYRKVKATIAFHNWLDDFFNRKYQKWLLSLSKRRKLVLRGIISLYPEYSFGKLSAMLFTLKRLKKNPFLFLYYWVDLFFLFCKRRRKARRKRMCQN